MYVLTIDQRGSSTDVDRVPGLLAELCAALAPAHASSAPSATRSRACWSAPARSWRSPCTRSAAGAGTWASASGPWTSRCRASPREGSGPAFVAARLAVERAKSAAPMSRSPSSPAAGAAGSSAAGAGGRATWSPECANAEAVLRLIGRLVQDRTAAQWKVVDVLRGIRHGHAGAHGTPEDRRPATRNHRTIGEPCAAPLRLAGRMGGEACGGNAAGPGQRPDRRHGPRAAAERTASEGDR